MRYITRMDDETRLLSELLRHMPADVRTRPADERRAWLSRAARHVREQRREEEAQRAFERAVRAEYEPRHPELAELDRWRLPSEPDPVELGPGVFGFELVPTDVRAKLVEEIDAVERWASERGLTITRPNSMNRYGLMLNAIGYRDALAEMMRSIVQPLAREVYPDIGALVDHHGFAVEYELGKDVDLALHVDDAEVTLNVCLGERFDGGALGFRGVRCPDHVGTPATAPESFEVEHQPGWAVLHHGRHRHRADALRAGRRVNLILWCRSEPRPPLRPGEGLCPPWCGVHPR